MIDKIKVPKLGLVSRFVPLMPALLLALVVFLLTGCAGRSLGNDVELSDIDVQTRENAEVTEIEPSDLLSVHFIDVGEGDAILVVQGNYTMLVDGGPVEMGTVVFSYLRDLGITTLEYMVATHPFADHVGGLPDVLRRTTVRNVLLPMVYHDTPAYNNFLIAVEGSGAAVDVPFAGDAFTLGDANITILAPNIDDVWENRANYSIVMRVEFGSTSFLLMGDAMREVEANLLDSTVRLSADVLKVARHGASSATTTGFLDAVSPSIAVISAGEGNSFLSQDTLIRLSNAGVHTFRTDLNGSVVVTSDGTTLSVVVER